MVRSIHRTLALSLTLALGPAFLPLGCGGALGPAGSAQGDRDAEVPERVAMQLTTCAAEHIGHLWGAHQSVSFEVTLASDGQVDAVAVRRSTLGDEPLETCMVSALRSLSEDDLVVRRAEARPREPVAPEARALLGQPGVGVLGCLFSPPCLLTMTAVVGITAIVVSVYVQPSAQPGPRIHHAPAKPQVQEPTKPDQDPRPEGDPSTTGPTPPIPPPPPDCPRNERFTPRHTDNAMGCIDKKGNLQCYKRRHSPCAGVHTHGSLKYQEIRRGVCLEVDKRAVRCEGPFKVSGPCGSVPTVGCGDGGPETSGIFEE